MTYPTLRFHRIEHPDHERSRYRVYDASGRKTLGEVYSLHTGGWCAVADGEVARGYRTRYEAGYSLVTRVEVAS